MQVSIKLNEGGPELLRDEQLRHLAKNPTSQLREVNPGKLCGQVIDWFLKQPIEAKDAILANIFTKNSLA